MTSSLSTTARRVALIVAAIIAFALPVKAQDGAQLFEDRCSRCHIGGSTGPTIDELASYGEITFLALLDAHPDLGGTVASLSDAQAKAIHSYIRKSADPDDGGSGG